jgi:hypothetical protein
VAAQTSGAAAEFEHGAGGFDSFPVKGEIILKLRHLQIIEAAVTLTAQGQKEFVGLLMGVKDIHRHLLKHPFFGTVYFIDGLTMDLPQRRKDAEKDKKNCSLRLCASAGKNNTKQ